MCPMALALTSQLRVAPEPPCVLWLQLPPPSSGQLRSHHVSHGGSTGCEPLKKTNIPWRYDHHDLHQGMRVSSKVLRDKGGIVHLQGM
jgi:hypothetical protein